MTLRLAVYAGLGVLLAMVWLAWVRGPRSRRQGKEAGEAMVFDPACSTYLPSARALRQQIGGVTYHFCSRECADSFAAKSAPQGVRMDHRGCEP
jgi:YHS domain-containing protein